MRFGVFSSIIPRHSLFPKNSSPRTRLDKKPNLKMTPTQASWVGNHCIHNFALTGKFFLCWQNTCRHAAKNRSCCVGAVLVHSHIVDLVTNEGSLFGIPQKKITRLLYRAIWDIPRCQPNKLRPFRDAEKLFGIPKNFSGCRKKISASRKDFDLGGFKLVVRSHILRKI